MSGYAPVKNRQGGAVAVPGTDMAMASVLTHGNPSLCHLLGFM
ncbi:MAG: hypothetical protein NTY71_04830 [Methanoregula sp.]|jgi:hypothetical protein|nr:hypothetical protein [Methanoregula sp.]